MAISAGVALLSSVVGVATGAIVTVAAFVTRFLITTAIGAALNALSPKPRVTGSGGYSFMGTSGSSLDHQIVYGRMKVGGIRIYDSTTNGSVDNPGGVIKNNYLHRVLAFAGHEIESFEQIYINDDLVTLNSEGYVISPTKYTDLTKDASVVDSKKYYVRVIKHLGQENQAADSILIGDTAILSAGKWTSAHKLSNIAYLYVRFRYNADMYPNGIPVVSAVVKGKKVYNPTTGTTAWSDNPALCLRDYITSGYGLSVPSSRIDDEAVKDAQAICNQIITADNNEKRYTCNGAFITGSAPKQIISDLITSMGGLFWYSQGKWRMKAAAYTTPTITLTEDDLRSGISLSTRQSRRDNFNNVTGLFRGAETDWQPTDYKAVTEASFVEDDNGIVNTVDYSLPFTTTQRTAQRLARLFLYRNREQLTISASFGLKAFQLEVGDFIYLTNERFGWNNKVFEVLSWEFGLVEGFDLQVNLVLREISSGVFSSVAGQDFEKNNTTLPLPFTVPAIGITDKETTVRESFENVFNVVRLTIGSDEPDSVERVEVQIQSNLDTLSISSVGTVQTMTFKPQTTAPFVIDNYVYVGNAIPSGLNGVFQVVSCTTSSVVVSRLTALTSTATTQGAIGKDESKYWTSVGVGDLGVYETSGLSDGTYSVRARAYNYLGVKGTWVKPDPFSLKGQAVPPASVSNLSHNLSGNNVNLQWTPVSAADLSYYKVRYSSATSGTPNWADAIDYVEKVARPASSVSVPAQAGTYMIRAYNKLGINSSDIAYVVIPTGAIDTFTNINTLTESPTFSGTSTNCYVDSGTSSLRITDTTTTVPSMGTYYFSNYIDLTTSKKVRATISLSINRYDSVGLLFDGLSGPFDSLSGLFDELTGGTNFDDTNIITYISITEDDPAGSPVWSDYKIFQAGDFYGRAFRFKIELKSNSPNVTPSISSLVAKLQYN
jgi:hypothetical protein